MIGVTDRILRPSLPKSDFYGGGAGPLPHVWHYDAKRTEPGRTKQWGMQNQKLQDNDTLNQRCGVSRSEVDVWQENPENNGKRQQNWYLPAGAAVSTLC